MAGGRPVSIDTISAQAEREATGPRATASARDRCPRCGAVEYMAGVRRGCAVCRGVSGQPPAKKQLPLERVEPKRPAPAATNDNNGEGPMQESNESAERRMIQPWTLEDDRRLREIAHLGVAECARILGRTEKSVEAKASALQISFKKAKGNGWSEEDDRRLREIAHLGKQEVARLMGRTVSAVQNRAHTLKLSLAIREPEVPEGANDSAETREGAGPIVDEATGDPATAGPSSSAPSLEGEKEEGPIAEGAIEAADFNAEPALGECSACTPAHVDDASHAPFDDANSQTCPGGPEWIYPLGEDMRFVASRPISDEVWRSLHDARTAAWATPGIRDTEVSDLKSEIIDTRLRLIAALGRELPVTSRQTLEFEVERVRQLLAEVLR